VPIRLRLALSFAAITLVLVVVGGVLFARSFRSEVESSLASGLRSQASALSRDVRAGLRTFESNGLSTADVVAQVLDPDGGVVATTEEAGPRAVIPPAVIREARDGRVFTNTTVRDGREREPFRVLASPVSTTDGPLIVVAATSLEPTDAAVDRVERALVIGGAIAVIVAGLGGWLLARAALRPVDRMRREAAEISGHDASAALPVPRTRDEIAALATTLNALLARLQDAVDRQRAFVADASHELRTPVAVLEIELELARRADRSRAELADAVGQASQQTARLIRLTDELLFLARVDEPVSDDRRAHPLRPIVEEASAEVAPEAAGRNVRIVVDADSGTQAQVDPDALRRAVRNLLANAARHSPAHGTVTARVRTDGDGAAVIEVEDDGAGFPTEFLPHAFERFRRADESRRKATGGTGLGLAIVLAVARAHGGTADARNLPEGGAAVSIRIPGERHGPADGAQSK
jgi:two-component system OmpR family sensor kinase